MILVLKTPLFFYCRKRSVLPIGFGKVSFLNSRSGGAYVEEAVEEHHHGTVQSGG